MRYTSTGTLESPWRLPSKYPEMGPNAQVSAMRNCILAFLEHSRRATVSEIVAAIGAPLDKTVRRQVQYLASTQQLYVDPVGRDPVYYRNGKMAHPLLQADIHAALADYTIRTYGDSLTGKYLTITEYTQTSLGESKAKGGIRVSVSDLPVLIDKLTRIQRAIDADPSLLEGGLVKHEKTQNEEEQ
jgi:hypothetical protein